MTRATLPKGGNGETIPLVPSKAALVTTYDTSVSSSTEITLNSSTNLIEVTALTQAILMKWGTADVTTSNFDNVIVAGSTRQFVVPVDSSIGSLYTAVNFIEQSASATLCLTEFS